jgi:hypothetical protein
MSEFQELPIRFWGLASRKSLRNQAISSRLKVLMIRFSNWDENALLRGDDVVGSKSAVIQIAD